MGFATGLLTGIAEGANKVISQDIADAKLRARELAKITAQNQIQLNSQRRDLLRSANKTAQKLAAKIGPGSDIILKNFINRYGIDGAVEATENLLVAAKDAGVSPAVYAGVSADALKRFPSKENLKALAEYATPPVQKTEIPDPNVGGWAKILGIGGPDRVEEMADSLVTSGGGVSKQDLTGLPEDVALPGLDKAFPVKKSIKEIQQEHVRSFIFIEEQKQNVTDPKILKNLNDQQEEHANALRLFRRANELMGGGVSLDKQYERLMIEGKDEEAGKILEMIQKLRLAKDGPPPVSRADRVSGIQLSSRIRQELNIIDKNYPSGKGGMTAVENGKTVELSPVQVKIRNVTAKILAYEDIIKQARGAQYTDADARSSLEYDWLPSLKRLKDERDRLVSYQKGGGHDQAFSMPKTMPGGLNPAIDKAFNKLKKDGKADAWIQKARSVMSKGEDSNAYGNYKSALRINMQNAGYGTLSNADLDTLITRLAAEGR